MYTLLTVLGIQRIMTFAQTFVNFNTLSTLLHSPIHFIIHFDPITKLATRQIIPLTTLLPSSSSITVFLFSSPSPTFVPWRNFLPWLISWKTIVTGIAKNGWNLSCWTRSFPSLFYFYIIKFCHDTKSEDRAKCQSQDVSPVCESLIQHPLLPIDSFFFMPLITYNAVYPITTFLSLRLWDSNLSIDWLLISLCTSWSILFSVLFLWADARR